MLILHVFVEKSQIKRHGKLSYKENVRINGLDHFLRKKGLLFCMTGNLFSST
ncbi:hypothetical protein JCM19047_454 [Bacillus sp. JCM 19047]|nr:hypothetical protein JCM19047_454 [Bacillus sp. JCM 19047]